MPGRFIIRPPIIYATDQTPIADEKSFEETVTLSKAVPNLFKNNICQVPCYQYSTSRASFRSEQNLRPKRYANQDRLMTIAGGMTLTSEDCQDYRKAVHTALHVTHQCLKEEKMADDSGGALIFSAVLPDKDKHVIETVTLGDCYAFHLTFSINERDATKVSIELTRLNTNLHEASKPSEQEHLTHYWAEKKLDGKLAKDKHGAMRLCSHDKTTNQYIPTLNVSRTIGDKNMHSSKRGERLRHEFANCPANKGVDLVLLSSDGLFEGCHNPDVWLKNMLSIFCIRNGFNEKSPNAIRTILHSSAFLDDLNAFLCQKARKKDTKAAASGDDLTAGLLRANQFNFGGIVDGHGPEGDLVAHDAAVNIPRRIGKYFPQPKITLRKTKQEAAAEMRIPEQCSLEPPSQSDRFPDPYHHEQYESYLPRQLVQPAKSSWVRIDARMQRAHDAMSDVKDTKDTSSSSSSSSSSAEIKATVEPGKRSRNITNYSLRERPAKRTKQSGDVDLQDVEMRDVDQVTTSSAASSAVKRKRNKPAKNTSSSSQENITAEMAPQILFRRTMTV